MKLSFTTIKALITITFLSFSICSFAQQKTNRQNNIFYYPDSNSVTDSYIKSQCRLDFYYPSNVKDYATIVWFHGGGITGGSKEIPRELMDKGVAVIGVGYRLSPKVKAPAYIDDAAAAVAWVFKNIEKFGGSKKLIFVSGHSAGGYLSTMITLDKQYLSKYGIDANSIAGIIPFSGQAITHFTVRQEQGIKDIQPTIDKYAPVFHVRADAPPMLLITGDKELEMLGRYEENAYFNRMMSLAGNKTTRLFELQGFDHGGMARPAFPLLLKEVARLKKEIQK
ncbi:alpha/beta hydrolase [Pedobacter frigoris]|uniref:Alpha/beta hydrolase n=1 Tax=Pedobacter frigoris TaxID=2571272 RepID=A0A4U1CEZ3_9SPHI|nr:alpha/beta hydrolase [Pedobacter frigoris]TKC02831.1 alpha/beta hydrolase [Pedobacter frigoris]